MIGTLNEGALHAGLKEWYRRPRDRAEEKVDGYIVDLVRGRLLIEIQTGGFAPLRRKLDALLRTHRVRLVAPVALSRRIVRVSDDGIVLSSRRSPKRGCVEDVFARLVSFPRLLANDRFELEIVLTHQDEVRMFRPGRAHRRRGWIVAGRSLTAVDGSVTIASPADAAALLPTGMPSSFDTAELASAAGIDRRLAQQMTYCLRHAGALESSGKRGRASLYRLAPAWRDDVTDSGAHFGRLSQANMRS
jgi:hypothetical protein